MPGEGVENIWGRCGQFFDAIEEGDNILLAFFIYFSSLIISQYVIQRYIRLNETKIIISTTLLICWGIE